MEDIFFDCRSETDLEREFVDQREGILKNCNYRRPDEERGLMKNAISYDDPRDVRSVLERAANNADILLRGLGGQSTLPPECNCMRFYPATLEIAARLYSDAACGCPPQCQCILRGSPVTLRLPLELNPADAQIKVNIFRPKPMPITEAGEGESADVAPDNKGNDEEPKSEPAPDGGGLGAGDRHGSTSGRSSIQRQPQRRPDARKSGRRVRWPDA